MQCKEPDCSNDELDMMYATMCSDWRSEIWRTGQVDNPRTVQLEQCREWLMQPGSYKEPEVPTKNLQDCTSWVNQSREIHATQTCTHSVLVQSMCSDTALCRRSREGVARSRGFRPSPKVKHAQLFLLHRPSVAGRS